MPSTPNTRNTQRTESERATFKEIFKIFLEDFIRDFCFRDVVYHINSTDLFTDDEKKRILSQENIEKQTCLMFFILLDKNKDLDVFLNILQYEYQWLPKKIHETHQLYLDNNKDLMRYIGAVHELKSHFPKHIDFNVHRLNYFYETRNILKKLQPRQFLVIHGELGFGKKWLALDACCDYSVMTAMNYKIFWMDVHNCNSQERDLEKLQRLKILLGESSFQKKVGDYEGISNKILELQQDLRTILKDNEFKDCLLVLVDVQNRKTLEAFNLPCKILITTRNKNIVGHLPNSWTKTVHVKDGLTQYESEDLFERILKQPKSQFPIFINDIFHQIRGHPFLLTIIAQNLKGQPQLEWKKWVNNLEHFRLQNDKINNLIELSFNMLNAEEKRLYDTLSIFHHSVKIPVKVLATLWSMTAEMTQTIVKKFDKFSLVNIGHFRDETVFIIHFLYYSYLQNNVKIDKLTLHKKLIENYNIENVLANRTEVHLSELPDDNYFYYFIGYHLRECNMEELFPKLYLDFGFLGQKLRAVGLASTIGDLKRFRVDITKNDPEKQEFLNGLLEFLPNIEEMIFRSEDTYLLQYALMASGVVQSEAEKQVQKFSDKIWFTDGDHFHRRRQMIKLPEKPKALKLVEPDTCIIALESGHQHILLLIDLSLGYNLEPTKFVGHTDKIIQISHFLKNYMLTLDMKGDLRVWSIADERRRNVQRKPSCRSIDVIDYETFSKMRTKECLQQIGRDMDGRRVMIKTFHIEFRENNSIYLHLVFDNGNINIYKWNEERKRFIGERIPPLKTRLPNIRFVLTLFNRYYMILNNSGSLEIFKVTDGSNGCPTSFLWPSNTNSPINIHYWRKINSLIVIFVFAQKILQLSLHEQMLDFLHGDLETLYEISDPRTTLTCSSLSDDKRYLVVGTKQGILVFDVNEKSEVLRNSISEKISCVDICSLDDEIYKYVIVSGLEGRSILNIFGMKLSANDSITWASSISALVNEEKALLQLEPPNAWLLGKNLFDVSFKENVISLVAVDSKNRIHQLIDNNWTPILPENLNNKITAITTINDQYYYGCENGDIFNSFGEKIHTDYQNQITYLNLIDENVLVGSYLHEKCFIYINNSIHYFDFNIEKCYNFADKYIILLNKNCAFMVINIAEKCSIVQQVSHNECLKSSDLQSNCLAVATERYNIYMNLLIIENDQLMEPESEVLERSTNNIITSVALSAHGILCAIGLENGLIEIYRKDKQWKLIQKLDSHKSPIYDLKFSPWTDFKASTILASASEQLCFWDITYIINNPLDHLNGFGRRSSRFSSSGRQKNSTSSSRSSSICISPTPTYNPWSNKKGPSDKPELLACIKFVGNRAEKFYTNENFTKFVTIDDEGEYYLLAVKEINSTNGTTNEKDLITVNYNEPENDNAII